MTPTPPSSCGETHSCCNKRLKEMGGKAQCCYCVPHDGCEFTTSPSSWEGVKELVEKMKAKYPPACNIESLEPALTQDITEIVGVLLTEQREAMVKMVEDTPIEKAHTYASENADDYRLFDAGQEHYKQLLLTKIKSK